MKTQRLCSLLTAAGVLLASVPFAPRLLPESTLTAYAADEVLLGPNHRWTLDDEGTLTITGTGAMRENIITTHAVTTAPTHLSTIQSFCLSSKTE